MSFKKFNERVIANHGKYVSNYNDQLLCSMYFGTVMSLFGEGNHQIGKHYKFLKEVVGPNRSLPISPMKMSSIFSPRQQSTEVFNTFNNAQLSSLTPLIEMFVKNEDDGEISPIPLQNIHGAVDTLQEQGDSYSFLGLKEITIDLKGDSFETRKRDIDMSIVFYANNLNVFNTSKNGDIYIPLIHPFHKNKGNRFRLMLKTGWNDPTPASKESLFYRESDKAKLNAIKKQKIVYELQYTNHTFDFNEDGSFTIQVNYVSSIEDSLYDISYTDSTSQEIKQIYPQRSPKKLKSKREKQIDDYIRENHPASSASDKKRIYNYFASEPGTIDKSIANKKETIQSRNTKTFHDMLRLLDIEGCTYTVAAKKSIVQNEMFVRAFNAATFADLEGNSKLDFKKNFNEIYQLQKDLTGLVIPSATGDPKKSIFNIQDFELSFSPKDSPFDSRGDTKTFAIFRGKPRQNFIDFTSSLEALEDPEVSRSLAGAHPAVWHVFNVYKLGDVLNAFISSSPNVSALKGIDLCLGPIEVSFYSRCFPFSKVFGGNYLLGSTSNQSGYGMTTTANANIRYNREHPLYDIPVTYQMLQRIVAEDFASTTRHRLTYYHFLNSLISRVVRPYFLEGDPALNAGQSTSKGVVRTYQKTISKKATIERESIPHLRNVFNPSTIDIEETKRVHLTFCGPADAKHDVQTDVYRIGSAGSVIKKVQFSQPNVGVQKARATDNAAATYRNGRSELLPQLFNVQMDIVGNLSFYPGYIFDLKPAMIGVNQDSQERIFSTLGLLGKYFTTHVQHKIGLEGFTTKIVKAYNFGAQDPK